MDYFHSYSLQYQHTRPESLHNSTEQDNKNFDEKLKTYSKQTNENIKQQWTLYAKNIRNMKETEPN